MMNIQSAGNAASAGLHLIEELAGTAAAAAPLLQGGDRAGSKPEQDPSLAQVVETVQNINRTLQLLAPSLEFSVDAESNRTIVKVIDQETKEVIRQMPSAESLEIAKALDRVQGLLIRQKG
ncbi:MAG: flagellar protein FlaG [Ramlibacter sp.]